MAMVQGGLRLSEHNLHYGRWSPQALGRRIPCGPLFSAHVSLHALKMSSSPEVEESQPGPALQEPHSCESWEGWQETTLSIILSLDLWLFNVPCGCVAKRPLQIISYRQVHSRSVGSSHSFLVTPSGNQCCQWANFVLGFWCLKLSWAASKVFTMEPIVRCPCCQNVMLFIFCQCTHTCPYAQRKEIDFPCW